MKKYKYFCLAFMMATLSVEAQEAVPDSLDNVQNKTVDNIKLRSVSGRVTSTVTKSPLAGALITVSGYSKYSTLSNEDGTFQLNVPVNSSALIITAPDHNMIRVGLNSSGLLSDIVMYPSVVRGKYENDINIMNNASINNFEYSSELNITSEIANQLGAAVHTISRGGTPGIGNYMSIDGINSLYSNAQPLIVIDGVILDQQYERSMIHDGFYNDILTSFNVNDIEKVEVMKNGTAIYGAKGANGVILIQTKRNKSLATKIDATVSAGITLLPKSYSLLNGPQFKTYASELLQTTGTNSTYFKFLDPDPATNYYYNKYNNNTNWNDYLYREAFSQNYGISVQGGGEVASYNLSLGYNNAQSTLEENDMDRLNVRFNTDIELNKHFFIRFDASFSNITRNLKDQGAPESYDNGTVTSINYLGLIKSPMLSPYMYANGQISNIRYDIEDEDYLNEALSHISGVNYQLANPCAINEYGTAQNKNRFENSLVNIAVTPKWVVNDKLSISSLFSYTLTNTNDKYYVPMNGVPSYYVASIGEYMDNEIRSLYSSQNSITSDTKVNWGNRYGAHMIDLMGGFRYMFDGYDLDTQLGYNTGNDKLPFIDQTSQRSSSGASNDWASLTWYAQAKYNYKERYYLQGDLAIESSSRFGKDAKGGFKACGVPWGVFPSIQAGWVLTNEDWFDVKGVDYVKLVAGYGMSGNDGIEFDASRSYFESLLFLNQANGLALGNIGNTEIQWETTRRFNVGLDMNFLKNRLNVKFNYFNSRTDNLLTLKELDFITGLENNWSNGGALKNQGFDVSFNAHLLSKGDWNWELGASMAHYKNELTELPSVDGKNYVDHEYYGATIRSQVGLPVGVFYGYKTATTSSGTCVYATSAEAKQDGLYVMAENGVDKLYYGAGDVKFQNVNGDKVINEKDMQVIGDPNPDIYGNIFTSLTYKRIRLDINFNYSLGNDVYNYVRSQLESGSKFFNQTTALNSRWTYEGQITNIPKVTWDDPMGNARFSDRWIEDGSYLRLKTITLSYNLPINNTYIHGLTFWGQANNVFTLTKYLGADPEFSLGNSVLEQGIDRGLLANSRNFVIGIKINL